MTRVSAYLVAESDIADTFDCQYDWSASARGALVVGRWEEFERFASHEIGLAPPRLRQAVADATELLLPDLATEQVVGHTFDVRADGVRFRLEIAVADDEPPGPGVLW